MVRPSDAVLRRCDRQSPLILVALADFDSCRCGKRSSRGTSYRSCFEVGSRSTRSQMGSWLGEEERNGSRFRVSCCHPTLCFISRPARSRGYCGRVLLTATLQNLRKPHQMYNAIVTGFTDVPRSIKSSAHDPLVIAFATRAKTNRFSKSSKES